MLAQVTIEARNSVETQVRELIAKLEQLHNEFSAEVDKHLVSGYTIPDVSRKISDKGISATQAMMVINEATYYGQQLSNLYYSYYAPRIYEIKGDISTLVFALTASYYNDPEVQVIKTSAEKERQLTLFASEVLISERSAKKLAESFSYLGKYTENIVFSLDRMQRMVDSLERLQNKDLWVDATANEQAFSIVKDNIPDFDDAVKAPIEKAKVVADEARKQLPRAKIETPKVAPIFDEDDEF